MNPDFSGLDPCVHCGFCLQSCPTYLATGDEADSPRGRIVLMRQLAAGSLPPTDPGLTRHLDRCLGCRACEPACPAGVSYGSALEAARSVLATVRPIPFPARLLNAVVAQKSLRASLGWGARMVRPLSRAFAGGTRLGFMFGMLAATRARIEDGHRHQGGQKKELARVQSPASAVPASRAAATLFRGCIMDSLFSHVHAATSRTLKTNGYRLVHVPRQVCCGALHAHSGDLAQARWLARRNVEAFETASDGAIVVNSAGCGATLKEYQHLLAGDPLEDAAADFSSRVRDVSELLAEQGPRSGAPLRLRVAYDPPCHLVHAQRIREEPLSLLTAIPKIEVVQHDEAEDCCGSAGSYSLTEPELSSAVLDRKIAAIKMTAPDVLATGNPGCVMQLGAGLRAARIRVPVVHPVEVLDWSYRRAGFYD